MLRAAGERLAGLRVRAEASRRYRTIVLVTVLSGLFSVGFTITILAVSIPTMAADLGSSNATLTWVITGPLLAFGVLGPAAGKAGDLFGHKRLYVVGMVLVGGFAALTAASWSAGSLIAFRVLGAAAGSAAGPASMAMINRLSAPGERVRAMGWFSFVGAGAPVLGVVFGGPIVEHLSWRLIFVIQAPLSAAVAVVAIAVLPDLPRAPTARFDVAGATTLGAGVTSLLFALNRASEWGWAHAGVVGCFVAAPLLLVAFVAVERRAASPLIPLEFFARRNFTVPALAQLFINFAYMGGFIITPLLLDEVFGYGETRIGLISISRPIFFSLAGPVAGHLATRVGERAAGTFGAVAVAVSMVLLSLVDASTSDLVIMISLAVSGIGLGASAPALAASVANSVPEESLGIAAATQQLMAQIGIVAGIQLMQTFQQVRVDSAGLVESYQGAYLLGAAVAVLGVVTAMFVRSTDRRAEPGPGVVEVATVAA